jgi:hypothetical protein
MMKPTGKLAAILGTLLCVGCRDKPAVEVKPATPREDYIGLALLTLRDATDAQQFRKAADLLNQQAELTVQFREQSLPAEAEEMLKRHAKLTAADIKEVRAEQLSAADAYYLEECFYFRDACHHLGLKGLPVADQVHWGWRWVERHVALGEAYDDALPALYVVRRGLGSPMDRMRVACALYFQLDLETALFVGKTARDRWLGVRSATDRATWWLIDLAAAHAIPTPLSKVRNTSPERLKDAEVRLLPDLQSLGLRMKALEQELRRRNEGVKLFRAFHSSVGDLQSSGDVRYNEAAEEPPSLRERLRFIPKEEGGLDTTYVIGSGPERWNRQQIFQEQELPLAWGAEELVRLRLLGPDSLPDIIAGQLLQFQDAFWRRWYLPPRQWMIRFQYDLASKQLSRTAQLLDDNDANLRDVGLWRDEAIKAFLADQKNTESKSSKLNALWDEDKYLFQILQAESDVGFKKEKQKTLSRIILGTTRQPLLLQTHFLQARLAEEKASQLQLRVESASEEQRALAEEKAKLAWENSREHWDTFPQIAGLRAGPLAERVRLLRKLLAEPNADPRRVIRLLELTHDQAFLTWHARLRQAAVQRMLDDNAAADRSEGTLVEELAGAIELAKVIEETAPVLRDPNLRRRYLRRLEILRRNHQPGGAVDLLRRACARESR